MGPRILRTETAGLAALAIMQTVGDAISRRHHVAEVLRACASTRGRDRIGRFPLAMGIAGYVCFEHFDYDAFAERG